MTVLADLNDGDRLQIVFATGKSLSGTVETDAWHDPAERESGVRVPGQVIVHLNADAESVEDLDLPSRGVTVRANESAPDEWDDPTATVWRPRSEHGGEEEDLGAIQRVAVDEATETYR